MPTKIKSDYKPSQRVYELLKAYGVQNPIEFVGHEIGAFFMYWEGTGKVKENWDSTCLNWMKRTYEDKKHATSQNRPFVPKKTGDIFEVALQDIKKRGTVNVKITSVSKLPPPDLSVFEPEPGPAMTSAEAFKELRQTGVLK